MCLTVPGKILSIDTSDPEFRLASVDFGGAVKPVNLVYTPDAEIGSYVIVHAGFATNVIPEWEALEALEYARELSERAASSEADSHGPEGRAARAA